MNEENKSNGYLNEGGSGFKVQEAQKETEDNIIYARVEVEEREQNDTI